jgi:hypothetical protein
LGAADSSDTVLAEQNGIALDESNFETDEISPPGCLDLDRSQPFVIPVKDEV